MQNTTHLPSLAYTAFALVLVSGSCLADEPATGYAWTLNESGHFAELKLQGTPLVRYMHAPLDESSDEKRAETYKPYLHVHSPDGTRLITKGPGGKFPHHRGIYLGFNKITYGDGKHCDTWHCTKGAYQQHQEFTQMDASENEGSFTSKINWHGHQSQHFATESRTQTVAKVDGMTRIDFESTLSCAEGIEKIKLDGDPQHAGVQFRAAQSVAAETASQTYYVRTDGKGKPGETRNWNHRDASDPLNEETTNRPWLAMSIVVEGQRYTVLYLDHPDNPKPARYSERDYGRFGSYFATNVTDDKPLKVKYRYFIKSGEMTADECQSLCDQFVGQ